MQHQRHLVNRVFHIARFDHAAQRDVAKHREFLPELDIERMFGAAKQDLRLQADLAQFRDALLRRLRFQFARRPDVRHERDVHVHDILCADFEDELPDRFQKRQPFDVAGRAADFGDDDVGFALLRNFANTVFDFVGHVRNDLDGFAEIVAAPFFENDVFVDLAAGEIVVAREDAVGEALVMAEVEIGLGAIVEHVDFAVLKRIHRPGIDVQIWIEFLEDDAEAAQLEQRAERSRRQAFAQGTHDSACNENVFHRRVLFRDKGASASSSETASSGVSTPGDPVFVMST